MPKTRQGGISIFACLRLKRLNAPKRCTIEVGLYVCSASSRANGRWAASTKLPC